MKHVLMKTAVLVCLGVAALAVGVAARGGGAAARPTLTVAYNNELKKAIIVDSKGMSLYAFTFADAGKPACYTDAGVRCVPTWPSCVDDSEYHCIKAWPALTVTGRPSAGKGVKVRMLGVARRRDGRLQAIYNHHPLYYYAGFGAPADKRPGDVNGQGFGGLWWVLSPAGAEIH